MTALSTNSGNILIVDDDQVIRQIIVTIVSALGYAVNPQLMALRLLGCWNGTRFLL
nr:hypothetical protein [Desulfobulbaceae bacterium]